MMPVYRFMDSLNGNNVPYNLQHRPSFDNLHPRMNPAISPVANEWPYANNLGYPVIPYPCCSYGYLPGYSPSAPFVLPNQFHCCGHSHPAFPQSYPVHYVPPLPYSMNIPRYEFDKMVPTDHSYHCGGYPNHVPSERSSNNLKVEEQELDDERKNSNCLVPVSQSKNHSYPIVWIPPDYLKEKEHTKYEEPEGDRRTKEKRAREMRFAETQRVSPSISDPRAWSVGVPFNLNKLRHLIGDADGKKTKNHQNQDEKEQFSFPMIWIPYYNGMKNEEVKEEEEKKDNQEPAPIKLKDVAPCTASFPVRQSEGGDEVDVPRAIQDTYNGQVASDEKKNVGQRSILVKQIEKAHPEDSMKSQDNSTGDKVWGSNAKRQSTSLTKALKLPPVCLRVDPLPKKRNGNVASRSPSPTGSKVKQEASKNQSLTQKESHEDLPVQNDNLVNNNSVEAKEKEGKVIPVDERKSSESQVLVTSATDSQRKGAGNLTMEKKEQDSIKSTTEEAETAQVARYFLAEGESKTKEVIDMPSSSKCEHRAGKKELSDDEAALHIQSAYRGFAVRRWEPLKKLKEIDGVREKVAEIRDQIQTLESSFDPQKDGRQKLVIGEKIMSLLLKLDTIQGLDPSLRDIRKSLARELITLQEKLDMLMVEKSEEMTEIPTVYYDGQTREPEEQSSNISSKCDAVTNQLLDSVIAKDENITFEQEAGGLPPVCESSVLKQEEDFAGAVENPSTKVVPSECEVETSERADCVKTRIVAPDTSEGRVISKELEDGELAGSLTALKELPQAVSEEEPTEQERAIAADGERKPSLVAESLIGGHNLPAAEVTNKPDLANELPVGVIDEQDSEKLEMIQTREREVLCVEEATDFLASELPVAILDEDEPMEEESSEVQSEDSGSSRYKVEEETIEKIEKKDALIDLSEQQPMEPLTDSARLSDTEPVKVDDDTGHEVFEGDKQLWHAVDADNKSKVVEATKLTGREQVPSSIQKESYDGLCGGEESHISVQSNISVAASSNLEEDKQTKEGENVPKSTMEEEKVSIKEQADTFAENLRDANEPIMLENSEEEFNNVCVPSPEYKERDQDAEVVVPPPCDSQLSIKEHDIADKRILEENQLLKEMVEKLVEAGKEQLNVISSLTGRVKDLEKKLSRKKKERPTRFRVSPRSCLRQSNELQK